MCSNVQLCNEYSLQVQINKFFSYNLGSQISTFLDLAVAKSLQSTRMVTDADADDDADDDDDV